MLSNEKIDSIFDPRDGAMQGLGEMARRFARRVESAATAPLLARIAELDRSLDVMAKNTEAQAHASLQREIELTEKVEKLTRELEEARKDAERYRWLRDTNMERPDMTDGSKVILAPNEVTSIWYGLPEDQWEIFGGCLQCSKGEKFDAAIDAAIKEQTWA